MSAAQKRRKGEPGMKGTRHSEEQIIVILKQLEDENRKLKHVVADLTLDNRFCIWSAL
jgi:hypothetical protein